MGLIGTLLFALAVALPGRITLPVNVPVDPDAPEARDWLLDELSKDRYQATQPNLFDQFADWLNRLLDGIRISGDGAGGPIGLIIVIAVIAAILVVAFLVYGRPRLNRRSTVTGALFGDDDVRDAADLRLAAERAAASGDYTAAIVELFRSLARGLAEREIVHTYPGTTAREFATRAGRVFVDASGRLGEAAAVFDGVRYLDSAGTVEQWKALVTLERDLRSARPPVDRVLTTAPGPTP